MELYIILWFLCGLLSYGWLLASLQNLMGIKGFPEYKITMQDRQFALLGILFGLSTLLACFVLGDYKYGWKL